ncbi:MAG: hypothetical protein VX346_02115 [Planctomycetota bacterium]|nr:hypothetical protein [Planctomycetota bacterium]
MYARNLNDGTTQFYGMSGILVRGDLMVGLVKVLQDHLNATPGKTAAEMGSPGRAYAGFGYTVLARSRDGVTWQRDHEPFIPRNRVPGTFDYANARGEGRVRLLDADRKPLDGFGWVEFKGDSIGHEIEWNSGLSRVSGKVVRLEFQLKDAQLFGFDLK